MKLYGSVTKYISVMSKNSNEFIDKYLKVKRVIKSCETLDHIEVTKQMIENLSVLYLGIHLPYEFYTVYINNLKFFLKLRLSEIVKFKESV